MVCQQRIILSDNDNWFTNDISWLITINVPEYELSIFVRTLTSRLLVGSSAIIMSGVLSETIRQHNDSRIFSPPLRTEHGFSHDVSVNKKRLSRILSSCSGSEWRLNLQPLVGDDADSEGRPYPILHLVKVP